MTGIEVVKLWYKESDRSLLKPDIVWQLAPHFPKGGYYIGRDDIFENVFASLLKTYPDWQANIVDLFDAGSLVVVNGYYTATSSSTGDKLIAKFVHLWEVKNGLINKHTQYVEPKF